MYKNLKIVKVDYKYCDFLRNFDNKVVYNAGTKELRPFIGVLFTIRDFEYFAPLSSPKPKHQNLKNTIDIIKINNGIYGVINFNNMIPVNKENYTIFDFDKKTKSLNEKNRIELLKNQLRWINSNKVIIMKKSRVLYDLYVKDLLPKNVKDRCCNFPLLEEKLSEYNQKNND